MGKKSFLDYAALQEWKADIISYEITADGFILQTTDGRRRLMIAAAEDNAAAAYARSEYIYRNGCNRVSRLIADRFGEYWTQAYNGWYYLVDAYAAEYIDYASTTAVEAAETLASFHLASRGYREDGLTVMSFSGEKLAKRLLSHRVLAHIADGLEQDMEYLQQSMAMSLGIFNQEKKAALAAIDRERGGLNLGGRIENICLVQGECRICGSNWHAGSGICDLRELLLQTAYACDYHSTHTLQVLKAYNRICRLEKEELDLLFSSLLLPERPIRLCNAYIRGEIEQESFVERLHEQCEEERRKNRWVKHLLM